MNRGSFIYQVSIYGSEVEEDFFFSISSEASVVEEECEEKFFFFRLVFDSTVEVLFTL